MEIEYSFVILSEHPAKETAFLTNLAEVGEYQLTDPSEVRLHDLYVDTPDNQLGERKISLRLRDQDGRKLITLKGPSQGDDLTRPAHRLELELPWSREALADDIERSLLEMDLSIALSSGDFDGVAPEIVLRNLGLLVVQERETLRRLKAVRQKGDPSAPVLAHLAIDSTTYHYASADDVRHHEVEIEAASDQWEGAIQAIAESVVEAAGRLLEPWPHGKYVTGKAIASVQEDNVLDDLLDHDRSLTRPAYRLLDERIRKQDS